MQSQILPISHSLPKMATSTLFRDEDQAIASSHSSSSFEDDSVSLALLPRISRSSSNISHQRRRRTPSETSLTTLPSRQQSFSRDVGHAAAETYLLTRLSFRLLRYLGLPVDWKVSCPWFLCNVTYARFSASWILLFLLRSST